MINSQDYYNAFIARDDPESQMQNIIESALSQGDEPIDILLKGLIPALESVGQEFGKGKLFLPELIFSGQMMKQSVEWLKDKFGMKPQRNIGTVVLGTVRGDLHDIGKSLVGMIAEGSGFEVIDIGIDVPEDAFIAAIETHQPKIVGLSALLTTTMIEFQTSQKILF